MNAPAAISSRWQRVSQSNALIGFIDVTLRGCAQVMFQNNPLTGLIFFIAIFLATYEEGNPAAAYGCVLGTVVATLTGLSLPDRASWRAGLYGYNGCLVGVALPTFLAMTPLVWGCIVLGSIVSVIATVCIADVLKTWKIAALTAPFVLTTWVILLSSYMFSGLHTSGLPIPKLPSSVSVGNVETLFNASFYTALFQGISQVYLLSSVIAGVLFIIGLAVSSLWAAVFAVVGSLLAMITASILSAHYTDITSGLYSFSAVLTAIALGSTFNKPSWRILAYTLVGIIFTVFVQGAMNALMLPIGVPTLTMPFVFASWLFLVPNQDVMPAHRQV
ncbi:urea transporter [Serratia oryzae]|jgi:urea transporter|uniref:Urea transporter n=1 Tax=Serratia oryzae TaxID=2034155 RepID=A0A1S8CKU8_9GAMM|nr:urea transporter [Serratia oryzae]OMQ23823.1 urea transporter [Serratia oryzae]VXD08664.1 Urea transporter [Enterobacterales bacterium 8AC]